MRQSNAWYNVYMLLLSTPAMSNSARRSSALWLSFECNSSRRLDSALLPSRLGRGENSQHNTAQYCTGTRCLNSLRCVTVTLFQETMSMHAGVFVAADLQRRHGHNVETTFASELSISTCRSLSAVPTVLGFTSCMTNANISGVSGQNLTLSLFLPA